MRIGIDVKVLAQDLKAGISYYTYYLIKNLARIDNQNEYYLYSNSEFDASFLSGFTNIVVRIIPGWRKTVWLHTSLPRAIEKDKIDIFHSPDFLLPFRCSCKTIITVHDIITFLFPKKLPLKHRWMQKLFLPASIKAADKIIVDSENTKNDLIKKFKVIPEKLEVIYLGIDPVFSVTKNNSIIENLKNKYSLNSPFILYVGTIEPRKNINKILEAYGLLREKGIKLQLVIAGGKGWFYKEVIKQFYTHKYTDGIKYLSYVPKEELPVLYGAADVFVFPSVYEGFGLPPLESMACGTPVVVSNTSSLPEVVGDAGILVNPNSKTEIAEGIEILLKDKIKYNLMVEKGLKRAQDFTWEKMAHKVLNIYKDI